MSIGLVSINERLRLGIEAARAGQAGIAREHFTVVLKQDARHVPAILWLAYVVPAPQDSLRLLEHALILEPQNESVKAGLFWARGRLGLLPDDPDLVNNQTQPMPAGSDPIAVAQPLPAKPQHSEIPKSAPIRQTRHPIKPLLAIFFIAAALGMIAIGLGTLIFAPNSLAAWLPAPAISIEANIAAPAPMIEPVQSSRPISKSFTSASDTLLLPIAPSNEAPAATSDSAMQSVKTELPLEAATSEPMSQPDLASIDPGLLIGPVLPLPAVDRSDLTHQPAYPGEKWIEVNVTTQQVIAWEGQKPVMSFVVSTGLPQTPTILGEFNIYWKLESTLMTGPGYYLPEVPYTMYFYKGYALHGTYWHNNFGQPMSHGCVNLQTDNAKQLFEWASPIIPTGQTQVVATYENPGTLVVVRE